MPTAGARRIRRVAPASTHVLIVPSHGGQAALHPIVSAEAMPGLAVLPRSRVELDDPVATVAVSAEQADEALVRLGPASRALAAAERAHVMAIEHAKARHQFDKAIVSFEAVQQRVAACQIDVSAVNLLLIDAVRAWEAKGPDALLRAEIATEHARRATPRVQLGAQRTLAAMGYFEAVAYAKQREQRGHPIIEFQAIHHLIAEMVSRTEACRQLLYWAATCKD